jgi:hypothetical protein
VRWVASRGADIVGRRVLEGLLLNKLNSFRLELSLLPSDNLCFALPRPDRPESTREGVGDMIDWPSRFEGEGGLDGKRAREGGVERQAHSQMEDAKSVDALLNDSGGLELWVFGAGTQRDWSAVGGERLEVGGSQVEASQSIRAERRTAKRSAAGGWSEWAVGSKWQ